MKRNEPIKIDLRERKDNSVSVGIAIGALLWVVALALIWFGTR